MANGNQQVTIDTWAQAQAAAIIRASKSSSDAGVTMIRVAKIIVALLAELEFSGQDLPGYGSGWLELIRDYCDDRLKD